MLQENDVNALYSLESLVADEMKKDGLTVEQLTTELVLVYTTKAVEKMQELAERYATDDDFRLSFRSAIYWLLREKAGGI